MSADPRDQGADLAEQAMALQASVAAAEGRARARLRTAIDDFFIPESGRLDDRLRSAMSSLLRALIATVEAEIRQHAARLLEADSALAVALAAETGEIAERLFRAGLLRDPDFMAELVVRAEIERLSAALPPAGGDDPDRPSLLPRLIGHPDRVVAAAAMALLIAESRVTGDLAGRLARTDLPSELHHRLVWWVAAALRDAHLDVAGTRQAELDRALAQSALRSLTANDEGERPAAAAMRLALALDLRPDELPIALVDALADRRVVLFIALITHAGGFEPELVAEIVLDPDSSRLWLVLRGVGCGRIALAQIAEALVAGDRRRETATLGDDIDAAAALPIESVQAALERLRLHRDYRAALRDLDAWR